MNSNEKIKELRKRKGISQKELAKIIGVSHATINKIELGKTESPSIDIAIKIAKVLDVDVYELFENEASNHVDYRELRLLLQVEKHSKQNILIQYVMQTMQEIKHYKELSLNMKLSLEERNIYKKWAENVFKGLDFVLSNYLKTKVLDSEDISKLTTAYPTWSDWKDFMLKLNLINE